MTKSVIAYVRVSTDRQGKSGLGLEAQRAQIATVAGGKIAAEFIEVETAKGDALTKRPQLVAALAEAKRLNCPLIIAKLDRLTRNVDVLRALINSDVDLIFCDMPHVPPGPMGRFLLTQMAAVAELEAGLISERTKAALAAAKARGVVLGQPIGNAKQKNAARAFAASLRAIVEPMLHLPSRAIAAALNERGVLTATGGLWSSVTVLRLIERLQEAA